MKLLMDTGRSLVYDLMRKAETVWDLKEEFGRYKTFAIGEKVYLMRTKMGEMIRLGVRSQKMQRIRTTTQLIRNMTNLQRMGQELFLFMEELLKYDSEIMNQDKIRNVSRLSPGENCQVAGSMAIPASVMDDHGTKKNAARRQHIINTYLQEPRKPAIDVRKEISDVNKKITTKKRQDDDIIDLAPDIF
ncbi:uncharacterized protein LOC125241925 [Leguminivora glycinivorella]|uniref:uncharacterized protein LOC125241925 n=1 Tax=Leguminivora glycinivorella TaxID=1035111 RepID=UPI00200F551F|nr:uncharacterized protein LOC125241925 [Leguminivora glycinivorella]XP_048006591.1 uncharacterized protein LOC125241925 [Leguminivora glycinivorella]XP_048006592.1 uncharacterized protein LOC125241925 [Leguminivora glycinivorella]